MPEIIIRQAERPEDVEAVKQLFREYAEWLNVDLCFQGFEEEMRTFPAFYEVLFLGLVDGEPVASIGLKDLGEGICEMKRLYVREAARKSGLGRKLSVRLIEDARERGFKTMRLDTAEWLKPAIALYEDLGFKRIAPYYDNPLDEIVYMELFL